MFSPGQRGGHSATVVGNTMYLFGGNTLNDSFNDLWKLNLEACVTRGVAEWEEVAPEGKEPLA